MGKRGRDDRDREVAGPRSGRPRAVTLPPAVESALAGVMSLDRRWFEAHPDARWRVRPTAVPEHEANALVAVASGDAPSPARPFVLVVRSPQTPGWRARYFVSPQEAVAIRAASALGATIFFGGAS